MIAQQPRIRHVDASQAEFFVPPPLRYRRQEQRPSSVYGTAPDVEQVHRVASTAVDGKPGSDSPSESKLRLAGYTLEELERVAIIQTLQECCGNRTQSARKLGISVRTLQRKLRLWGSAKPTLAGVTLTEERA